MDPSSIVRVDGLVVRYGTTVALGASTFELRPGTVTALIGANGSGKTTLLHALAGIVAPTLGSIEGHVGVATALVAQQHHHHRWMPLTVAEVVRMGRYRRRGLLGRFGPVDRAAVADAAERVEISDLLKAPFGELSGGQQQRVRIAQALAGEPAVLLLDEPITGLDPPSQRRILDTMNTERRHGTTVVFSTHHLDEAGVADQVLVLGGRVLAAGTPGETLRPDVLSLAFGGRMIVLGDRVVLDDHGHLHDHDAECAPGIDVEAT
ncbi:MAG: ATP-binding cassette domain-containing protein [Actinomycetota bacterium]|nr:ATP-binding cassette domain-containing protein [Actinomycetota bacterium]